jgi:hypothetical protein
MFTTDEIVDTTELVLPDIKDVTKPTYIDNYTIVSPLPDGNYNCSLCKFKTIKKKTYEKHLQTEKHKHSVAVIEAYEHHANLLSSPDYVPEPLPEDSLIRTAHRCYCGKIYKHRQSLSIHKKKCTYVTPTSDIPSPRTNSKRAKSPISESAIENTIEVPETNKPNNDSLPNPKSNRSERTPARPVRSSTTSASTASSRPARNPVISAPASASRPARAPSSSLAINHTPNLVTDPNDIILVDPFTPEQIRDAIFAIDAYETAVNEPTVNTFPDTVNIASCATSAVIVTAESLASNVTADSSISAIANVIASSFSEETRELCIHREVVVRCIKLVLPLYLNLLSRMNMQEYEDLPEHMIEVIEPDAPITIGYLALKSCINILYFILSRIDEQPINEGDDVVDISNSS